MVVVTQNIVRAAAWLLFALAGTAGVYFLLGSDFIGTAQLIVYVGGTLVLVVFGVMLTAQGPFVNLKTGAGEWAFALLVGVGLYTTLAVSTLVTAWPNVDPYEVARSAREGTPGPSPSAGPLVDERSTTNVALIGEAVTGVRSATPDAMLPIPGGHVRHKVSYLLPFEIVSMHLLVVLIGAAYLARAKRRRTHGAAA